MYDLIVSGNAFLPTGRRRCDIGIEDGRIAVVKGHIERIGSRPSRIALHRGIIVPGIIDAHVHFREPGAVEKADITTESEAALRGGTCTVLDMPNTDPPTIDAAAVRDKIELFSRRSHVDFGVFFGLTGAALANEKDSANALSMAVASKLYMASTTGGLLVKGRELMLRLVDLHRRLAPNKVLCVHAEDQDTIETVAGPERNTLDHNAGRPPSAELKAIQSFMAASEGIRGHIAHVSSADAIPALQARLVTGEVTPHHLLLDTSIRPDARGKVNPPLRPPGHREALWKALVDGTFDMVASDHAPHTREEKELPFDRAPSGVPGVGSLAPLLFAAVERHRLPLARFVSLTSEGPAGVYGLRELGSISKGKRANLVTFDASSIAPLRAGELAHKCGWTPFEGLERVLPENVVMGGQVLMRGGEFLSVAGEALDVASMIERPHDRAHAGRGGE